MDYFIEFEAINSNKKSAFRLIHDLFHGHVSGDENFLAISYPEYQCNDLGCRLGNRIRVVGNKKDLIRLSGNLAIKRLLLQNMIAVGEITKIPKNHINVRFIRDRTLDKAKKIEKETGEKAEFLKMPFFERKSYKNKYAHKVFIRKELSMDPVFGQYSSFGLSKDGTTVPYWK
jgi:CRISPR-associated endoribonuclease Cas6/Csy4 subtype I-F